MSIAQMLLGGYGVAAAAPALDGHTTGLWSATSFSHKMLTAYASNARLVRESAGSTTQTIGFSGIEADLASEATFSGGVQCHARTSYDHSGNANHWGQATNTDGAQPRTVAGGASETFGYSFANTTQRLDSDNASGSVAAITVFMMANSFGSITNKMLMEHTANINSADGFYFFGNASSQLRLGIFRSAASVYLAHEYSGETSLDSSVYCLRLDISEATLNDRVKFYKNGTLLTPTNTLVSGTVSGNFANDKFYVGGRSDGTLNSPIRLRHLAVYTGAAGLSDADIAAISNAMLLL
jgi:hypothetical protein